MEQIIRNSSTYDWVTLIIIICLVLLTAAKLIHGQRFNELFLLPVTNKYFLVHGKNKTIFSPFNNLLLLVQILSFALFIFILIKNFVGDVNVSDGVLYLQIVFAYGLFIGMKFYIEKIIGNLFSFDAQLETYLYHKLTFRNLMGIFLLAINILFIYGLPQNRAFLLIIIVSIVLANLISLFYSYRTNEKFIMNHFFYFILYLCALEISPYLILYKTVV